MLLVVLLLIWPVLQLAVALMDMLEYYQFADRLVVSHNKKLQFRGWLAVAKILKKVSYLLTSQVF